MLKLEDYKEKIYLDEPYRAEINFGSLDELMTLLMNELDEVNKEAVKARLASGENKRDMIKAMLTVRPAAAVY